MGTTATYRQVLTMHVLPDLHWALVAQAVQQDIPLHT